MGGDPGHPRRFEKDPAVRVIVVTGAGDKAFVSGADISEFEKARNTPEQVAYYDKIGEVANARLDKCSKPTIARIRGYCIGGGMAVSLLCDIRIASDNSKFGVPAARLGLGYRASGLKILMDLVGRRPPRRSSSPARHFSAQEALGMGLVTRVVPDAELDLCRQLLQAIGENAPLTMHAAKRTIEELTRLDGEPDFARLSGAGEGVLRLRGLDRRPPRLHGKAPAAIQRTLTMKTLTREQYDAFWRDGYLMVEDAVTPLQLAALQAEITGWVEESRAHQKPFGPPTIDGRPRFDMGAEHSAEKPALRRINNPSDISDAYRDVMLDARTVDMVADLVGPDVKFHHCKINLKLSGAKTEVSYHQDFSYTPHTNDDIVTALLFLDDIDEDNGCLTVVPGSHKGPVLSLFDGERFTGAVAADAEKQALAQSMPCVGKAGAVCLMHTKLLHGSAANRSDASRGLYICVYTAADAVPIARNPMPSLNEGRIVRGKEARFARLSAGLVELPKQPKTASFFTVIGQEAKQAAE